MSTTRNTGVFAYSLDTDPQGIRARVSNAIMGALAFGAQGNAAPPEGHWLAPFWNAARADAERQMAATLPDGWISVVQRLPMEPDANARYEQEDYLVTDGVRVTTCGFSRGNGGGKPWADWSMYGGMRAGQITHWQPLPPPPTSCNKEGDE